jgi:HK97 family phage prohead protease
VQAGRGANTVAGHLSTLADAYKDLNNFGGLATPLASALRSIPDDQVEWMNAYMADRAGGATAHPAATEKLHEYWVHGEGAAKIRWGTPGDFQRCVDHLDKYMPGRAQGYCNLAHKAATGMYPAQHAKMEKHMAEPGGMLTRSVPFEVTRADGGDGLTLEGYAAVFGRSAMIPDRGGDFEEQIAPGAFADSIAKRTPVLMFEHGKHPLIGTMPLGRIDDIHEDGRGLFISARLSDNWLIQPVRDAVRDGAVDGMSFRFTSPGEDDQRWEKRDGQPDLRTLLRVDARELGPVVFPAYEPTTASVRSLLDEFDDDFTGRDGARSAPGGGDEEDDVQPGNGGTSPANPAIVRDRIWRMRRRIA